MSSRTRLAFPIFTHMKKFTLSTLKSILKNRECSIMVRTSFDGMVDGCVAISDRKFVEIDKSKLDFTKKNTFGIEGLWLVGSSRDSFENTVDADTGEEYVDVYNCCGSCTIKFK